MTREQQRTELLVYRIKDNCYEVAKKLLEEHDKQIRAEIHSELMSEIAELNELRINENNLISFVYRIKQIAEKLIEQEE